MAVNSSRFGYVMLLALLVLWPVTKHLIIVFRFGDNIKSIIMQIS